MAIFYERDGITFSDHPLFKGVKIAKLAGSNDGSPIGSSILRIERGIEIPVHTHEKSIDSIYCLNGSGEVFIDGSWRPLSEGDYCFVPPAEEHGVRNISEQQLELFIVHCPPLF